MTACHIAKHNDHFSNDFVQIDRLALPRSTTVERAISVDDTGRTLRVIDDAQQGLAGLFKLGRLALHPPQAGLRTDRDRGDRLLDLVGQRRRKFSHHAHSVDPREISFQLAQSLTFLFGPLAFGNICYGPYEECPVRIFAGCTMRYNLNVFDGPIGYQQAILAIEAVLLGPGAINDFPDIRPIVRMCSIDHHLDAGLCRRIAFEYSICLVRPVDFSSRQVPTETPGVAQSLRLCQIHLAPAKRLLGPRSFGPFPRFAQRALHRWR